MGYAVARLTAQICYHLAIKESKRTAYADISMVPDRSDNRWEYMKDARHASYCNCKNNRGIIRRERGEDKETGKRRKDIKRCLYCKSGHIPTIKLFGVRAQRVLST